MKELTKAEKKVFEEVVKLTDNFASLGMLCHDLGKTDTTIKKHLKSLINKGYVVVSHKCQTYDCEIYIQTEEAKTWLS